MKETSPFTRASTLVAMHKVVMILNEVCRTAGDLSLVGYAFLLSSSRNGEGVAAKKLRGEFDFYLGDSSSIVQGLIHQELAMLVRDPADRRGLAVRVTEKGATRLSLIDEAMGLTLLNASGENTQESLESLIYYCRNVLFSAEEEPWVDTLIPEGFIVLLCHYQEALVEASARIGLSSIQSVILLLLDISLREITFSDIILNLSVQESILLPQLEFLENRGLLTKESKDVFTLSKEGISRIDIFSQEIDRLLLGFVQSFQEGTQDFFGELFDYCEYLFR